MNVIMLDTETTNDIESPFMYDIGFGVLDLDRGEIVERHSYIVAEVFLDKDLMASAYFIDKLPMYEKDLQEGRRKMARIATIKRILADTVKKYDVRHIVAHNARFDYRSTNGT